jgi:hypothetical protein
LVALVVAPSLALCEPPGPALVPVAEALMEPAVVPEAVAPVVPDSPAVDALASVVLSPQPAVASSAAPKKRE